MKLYQAAKYIATTASCMASFYVAPAKAACPNVPNAIPGTDCADSASNVELTDPGTFDCIQTWSYLQLDIPEPLSGLFFSDDGNTLYVVGAAETTSSALYAVDVYRDDEFGTVCALSEAQKVFDGTDAAEGTFSGLDAGWEFGPEGTLFNTYWNANKIGERPGGVNGDETLYDMTEVGVPTNGGFNSIAGLTFSPQITDSGTNFAHMIISEYDGKEIYLVPLKPDDAGEGLFKPQNVTRFATLPFGATGALQYILSGPFKGDLMITNWGVGELNILKIDQETGFPIDKTTGLPTLGTTDPLTLSYASDSRNISNSSKWGPWGLEFDDKTRDFFATTLAFQTIQWPYNAIMQFRGFPLGLNPDVARDELNEVVINTTEQINVADGNVLLGDLQTEVVDIVVSALEAYNSDENQLELLESLQDALKNLEELFTSKIPEIEDDDARAVLEAASVRVEGIINGLINGADTLDERSKEIISCYDELVEEVDGKRGVDEPLENLKTVVVDKAVQAFEDYKAKNTNDLEYLNELQEALMNLWHEYYIKIFWMAIRREISWGTKRKLWRGGNCVHEEIGDLIDTVLDAVSVELTGCYDTLSNAVEDLTLDSAEHDAVDGLVDELQTVIEAFDAIKDHNLFNIFNVFAGQFLEKLYTVLADVVEKFGVWQDDMGETVIPEDAQVALVAASTCVGSIIDPMVASMPT